MKLRRDRCLKIILKWMQYTQCKTICREEFSYLSQCIKTIHLIQQLRKWKETLFIFGRGRDVKLNIKLSSNCLTTIYISCFDIYTKSNKKHDGMPRGNYEWLKAWWNTTRKLWVTQKMMECHEETMSAAKHDGTSRGNYEWCKGWWNTTRKLWVMQRIMECHEETVSDSKNNGMQQEKKEEQLFLRKVHVFLYF